MLPVIFLGTYKPMVCGIADYTSYITAKCPASSWGVITFDTQNIGMPVTKENVLNEGSVWYGIPDRDSYSAQSILKGVRYLTGNKSKGTVLWFQHENGIWRGDSKFVGMLKSLNMPTIVTFHSLHFQSSETPWGLQQNQYDMLGGLLPYVDAITVFSEGVYNAVTQAFPLYAKKVYVLRHGIHSYPSVNRMSRLEAKKRLNDFLLYDSDLDNATKAALYNHHIFTDPKKVIIGQAGFLDPAKQSEILFEVRNRLENRIPEAIAVRIGSIREESQKAYAQKLRGQHDSKKRFLLNIRLPHTMLPVAQRAFDVNLYWPVSCTQSGILSHALGAGATIAGRDLEGAGEMLADSGQIVERNLVRLVAQIAQVLSNPWENAVNEELRQYYASAYSWEKQAVRHYEIAEEILKHRYAMSGYPLSISKHYAQANAVSDGQESYALVY